MGYRLPAEWEPQSAIQLTFPHENSDWKEILHVVIPCFVEIIEVISRFQKVLVVCADIKSTEKLVGGGIKENIIFVSIPSNDTWARDHGGITVQTDNGYKIWDFQFNGWGNKFEASLDNKITEELSNKGLFGETPIEQEDFILEGGAIESDGKGTLLTTSECMLNFNRNFLSQNETEIHLKYYFGIKRFLWLFNGYLAGDDTDSHIDTLVRFCNENTIAYVKCDDEKDEHFQSLKKMEIELQAFKQVNGKPYNLIALPFPKAIFDEDGQRLPATYANFLIINGAVLVPIYNVPQDESALKILKQVFSERAIIGIDCNALILQHGSLHCVTMQYPIGII